MARLNLQEIFAAHLPPAKVSMLLTFLVVMFSAFFPSLRGFDMELTERACVPQLQNSDTKRLVSSDAPDHVHLYELTRLFVRSTTPMSREETV